MSTPGRASGAGRRRSTRRSRSGLEQLAFDLGPERPRWRLSRLVIQSRYRERILERLEFVRRFFPELEDCTIRVGLARKRGVLGWGSLDPNEPGVWVRPRLLDYFTISHEFTHLLQARGLVPMGERACDLHALARSPLVVDAPPGYLRMPASLQARKKLTFEQASLLCDLARRALSARTEGNRRYLQGFEEDVAAAFGEPQRRRRPKPKARSKDSRPGSLHLALAPGATATAGADTISS